jgi:hypothetical protein
MGFVLPYWQDLDCEGSVAAFNAFEMPDNRNRTRQTAQNRGNAWIPDGNIKAEINQFQISAVDSEAAA